MIYMYLCSQLALDTFYWTPIHHVLVWGSILAWFVVLPITSSPGLYIAGIGVFEFDFLGVFYEVIQTATFWFYWPLAAVIALGPTIVFRTLLLDLQPTLVDDVRLKMKKEGQKLFRRKILKKKLPRITFAGVKERTGYAFSHQGGFGKLILSGRMFGGHSEEQVRRERERRISTIIQSAPSSPVPPHKGIDTDPTPSNLAVHTPQMLDKGEHVQEAIPIAEPDVAPEPKGVEVSAQLHESTPTKVPDSEDEASEPTTSAM